MKAQQLYNLLQKAAKVFPSEEVELLKEDVEEYSMEAAVSMWVGQHWATLLDHVRPAELFGCLEGFEVMGYVEDLLKDGVSPEALFEKLEQCSCFEDDPESCVEPLLRYGLDANTVAQALKDEDLPYYRGVLEKYGVSARYIFEHCPVRLNRWQSVTLLGSRHHDDMPACQLIEVLGPRRVAENIELLVELGVNLELTVNTLDQESLGECVEELLDLGYNPQKLAERVSLMDKLRYFEIFEECGVDLTSEVEEFLNTFEDESEFVTPRIAIIVLEKGGDLSRFEKC